MKKILFAVFLLGMINLMSAVTLSSGTTFNATTSNTIFIINDQIQCTEIAVNPSSITVENLLCTSGLNTESDLTLTGATTYYSSNYCTSCSQAERSVLTLIGIMTAVGLLAFMIWASGKGEMTVQKMLLMFLIVVIGVTLTVTIFNEMASWCPT